MKEFFLIWLLYTALFLPLVFLNGCATGTVVKVVPINVHQTTKQVIKAVKGDKKAEVVLIRIEF